jgi:ABC-2 type transport system ATP-binding protein
VSAEYGEREQSADQPHHHEQRRRGSEILRSEAEEVQRRHGGGTVEFRLLGAVEAWEGDRQIDLGPRQQRLVLAILALNVNQLVPLDRLVDLTWPDSPPHTARHAIHVRVSQLRTILAVAGADRDGVKISTRGPMYVMRADPMSVDAHRFRALLAAARRETNDLERASMLRCALDLWHGPPLADVATPRVEELCRRLAEARLTALEEWLDAQLRLGRHEDVSTNSPSTRAHPYRQRRSRSSCWPLPRGLAADALVAYRHARTRLVDELGRPVAKRSSWNERSFAAIPHSTCPDSDGRSDRTVGPPSSRLWSAINDSAYLDAAVGSPERCFR